MFLSIVFAGCDRGSAEADGGVPFDAAIVDSLSMDAWFDGSSDADTRKRLMAEWDTLIASSGTLVHGLTTFADRAFLAGTPTMALVGTDGIVGPEATWPVLGNDGYASLSGFTERDGEIALLLRGAGGAPWLEIGVFDEQLSLVDSITVSESGGVYNTLVHVAGADQVVSYDPFPDRALELRSVAGGVVQPAKTLSQGLRREFGPSSALSLPDGLLLCVRQPNEDETNVIEVLRIDTAAGSIIDSIPIPIEADAEAAGAGELVCELLRFPSGILVLWREEYESEVFLAAALLDEPSSEIVAGPRRVTASSTSGPFSFVRLDDTRAAALQFEGENGLALRTLEVESLTYGEPCFLELPDGQIGGFGLGLTVLEGHAYVAYTLTPGPAPRQLRLQKLPVLD